MESFTKSQRGKVLIYLDQPHISTELAKKVIKFLLAHINQLETKVIKLERK